MVTSAKSAQRSHIQTVFTLPICEPNPSPGKLSYQLRMNLIYQHSQDGSTCIVCLSCKCFYMLSCCVHYTGESSVEVMTEADSSDHSKLHTRENQYTCTQGEKRSGEKRFECTVCSKQFADQKGLVWHSRIHSGEKPYKCHVCNKAFNVSRSLNCHMRVHKVEKPHKCTVCNKAFSRLGHRNTHMRVHNGEKPYKCTVCNKAFSQLVNMNRHMRVHKGEKPYKCTVCNKAFSQLGNMNSHMRVHKGEKPYKCTVCNLSLIHISEPTRPY